MLVSEPGNISILIQFRYQSVLQAIGAKLSADKTLVGELVLS